MILNTKVKNYDLLTTQTAGQDTAYSDAVNVTGFEGVQFTMHVGVVEATGTIALSLQQSVDDSTYTDVTGSSLAITATDDNKAYILSVYHPREAQGEYFRVKIVRATANGSIASVSAVVYGGRKGPIADDSSITSSTVLESPAST